MSNQARKKQSKFRTIHVIEKDLKHHLIEWAATALTVLGALLNANILRIGSLAGFALSFHLWAIANLLWIFFAIKHRHWGVLTTFSILLIVNLWSIVQNKLWLW